MPEITEDTPVKNIVVAGLTLQAPVPYEEGHACNANEAGALNQTFHENLRNNFAGKVKKAQEEAQAQGAEVDTEALQREFNTYAEAYEFGVRSTSAAMDPVLAIAMELATERVKDALKVKGYKLKEVGTDRIKEMAQDAIEKNPAFKAKAEEIHRARSQAAEGLTVDLS